MFPPFRNAKGPDTRTPTKGPNHLKRLVFPALSQNLARRSQWSPGEGEFTVRVLLLTIVVLLSAACAGEYSATPEELARYEFFAEVQVNPTAPVAGRMVNLNLELSSRSNQLVVVDVILRAVRADGSVMHEQVWRQVTFHPEEVWNLTQGFLSRTDERGAFDVVIETRESVSGKVLWTGPGPTYAFR